MYLQVSSLFITGVNTKMGKRKGNIINGWINLDKPRGITSTDVVRIIKRALGPRKIGHGGTLDPLATGVLPIALGEATKTVSFCQNHLKTYSFTIVWGEMRDTDDAEGEVTATSDIRPTVEQIQKSLGSFVGEIEQIPPQYSAVKVGGERAYDRARRGKKTKLEPRIVYIESFGLLEAKEDRASCHVVCGKGTYVRSLARDLAKELGTYGYISELRRESVGPLSAENAISLDIFGNFDHSAAPEAVYDGFLLPVETVLDDIPALVLNEREAARLKNGQVLSFIARPDVERLQKAGLDIGEESIALAVYEGKPIALINVSGPEIQPLRVFNN
jgi:tRNA pseudouridine55 synthase